MKRYISFFIFLPLKILTISNIDYSNFLKKEEINPIIFHQQYSMNQVKNIHNLNKKIATTPGINRSIPFPFGQKNDTHLLTSVKKGYIPFTIISQRSPIDAETISRLALPPGPFSSIFNNAFIELAHYIPTAHGISITVHPNLLMSKNHIAGITLPGGIIGIEFNFGQKEQSILGKISRIALIFIQNITKDSSDKKLLLAGFNTLTLHDADNKKMLLINETEEQREYSRSLVHTLITDLKAEHNKIPHFVFNKLDAVLEALTEITIGIIIEQKTTLLQELDDMSKEHDLTYSYLSDDHYIFWNNSNKSARLLVNSIQRHAMPITSNYYLYGKIMDYSEEDIALSYQLEGFLRSINQVNADNSVAWPYNICKWGIKNQSDFNTWINKNWHSGWISNNPAYNKYKHDKREAQRYLKEVSLDRNRIDVS